MRWPCSTTSGHAPSTSWPARRIRRCAPGRRGVPRDAGEALVAHRRGASGVVRRLVSRAPGADRLIGASDLVILPYDSDDQVTSGVLVDAVASGRPVIATAFPHAVELLGGGAGVVVPQRDAAAIAEVVRGVVDHPERLEQMAAECRRLAPELSWPAVAGDTTSWPGRCSSPQGSARERAGAELPAPRGDERRDRDVRAR